MSQLSEAQKEEVRKIFVTSYYKDMKTLHRDTKSLIDDLIKINFSNSRPPF